MAAKRKLKAGNIVLGFAVVLALIVLSFVVVANLFPPPNRPLGQLCERMIGYSRTCDCLRGAAMAPEEVEAISELVGRGGLTPADGGATATAPLEGALAPLAQCHVTQAS